MTGNQAPPARPGRPAAPAATARLRHLAGRRPAGLPLAAAAKKTARYAPLLAGGATISSAPDSPTSMAFVPLTGHPRRPYGQASWYPIPVGGSSLMCPPPDGCGQKSANTVYQNNVMGLYTPPDSAPGTYLATVATP